MADGESGGDEVLQCLVSDSFQLVGELGGVGQRLLLIRFIEIEEHLQVGPYGGPGVGVGGIEGDFVRLQSAGGMESAKHLIGDGSGEADEVGRDQDPAFSGGVLQGERLGVEVSFD